MTPFTGDWDEYLTNIVDMEQKISVLPKFDYTDGDFNASVTQSYHTFAITYQEDGNTKDITVPYILTATGLKFMEPLEINGKNVETLEFQDVGDNGQLASGSIVLTPKFPLNYYLLNGDWYFSYKNLGAFGQTYWNYVKKNDLEPNNMHLETALFTPFSDTEIAFYWICDGAPGYLFFKTAAIGDNQVKITFALSGGGTGVTFYNNYDWDYMIYPFSKGTTGLTFTLTADDEKNPSIITMTDNSNNKNVIKVFKDEILDPFNN